jgi:hypothetical protein
MPKAEVLTVQDASIKGKRQRCDAKLCSKCADRFSCPESPLFMEPWQGSFTFEDTVERSKSFLRKNHDADA